MKKICFLTLLVLLIFPELARAASAENSLLLGTIQFPKNLSQEIPDMHILYRGDPASTQVDQSNKAITFSLPRESSQFSFKLLIAEPQSIEPIFLTSKYQMEPSNLIDYQQVKLNHAYRYFELTLIPEISRDATRHIIYRWNIQETNLVQSNLRIPDDVIIVHAVPNWIEKLTADAGCNFPIIHVRHDVVALTGSEAAFKRKLSEIALARIDKAQFEGKKQEVAMKQIGNAIIIAPPMHRVAG